jgi:hypothetical protein
MTANPSARPFIRQRATGPFWYAKWSRNGQPVIRALGRAWVESDGTGGWRRRRGRAPDGMLTEAMACERMLMLVRRHDAEQTLLERGAEERRRRGVTFRELAVEYLDWLEHVKDAKPSTLRDHRLLLAEPGQAYRRGSGSSRGQVMAALADRPAREVTTREVEDLLQSISSTGVAPRTVNKVRQLVCAIFNYGMRPSTYGLANNPVIYADDAGSPNVARSPSTHPSRSKRWLVPSQLAATGILLGQRSALRRSRPVPARTSRTRSSSESPHTPVFAAASLWPSAGVTSTSPAARSPSAELCPATLSCGQPRAVGSGKCRSPIRLLPRSIV